ncbi:MAG: DUF4406 domain-containing protein [Desulfosporosinus sp.]
MAKKETQMKSYDKIVPKVKIPSKRVYICSPLKGNINRNVFNARMYCRFAFDKGYVPIAPHIYYPQFLDESSAKERAAGIRYGLEAMWQASELWVFGEYISEGMQAEIDLAKDLKIPIKYFYSDMEECT